MDKPSWFVLARDTIMFGAGLTLLFREAGIPPFQRPDEISFMLLAVGALACNVPGVFQVIGWKLGRGTDTPPSPSEPPPSPTPSPVPSSGGE